MESLVRRIASRAPAADRDDVAQECRLASLVAEARYQGQPRAVAAAIRNAGIDQLRRRSAAKRTRVVPSGDAVFLAQAPECEVAEFRDLCETIESRLPPGDVALFRRVVAWSQAPTRGKSVMLGSTPHHRRVFLGRVREVVRSLA